MWSQKWFQASSPTGCFMWIIHIYIYIYRYVYIYIHIYIYICITRCIYIYIYIRIQCIYIYIYRERERDTHMMCTYIYIYIYTYICIYVYVPPGRRASGQMLLSLRDALLVWCGLVRLMHFSPCRGPSYFATKCSPLLKETLGQTSSVRQVQVLWYGVV